MTKNMTNVMFLDLKRIKLLFSALIYVILKVLQKYDKKTN